jgi:hypothetical protein
MPAWVCEGCSTPIRPLDTARPPRLGGPACPQAARRATCCPTPDDAARRPRGWRLPDRPSDTCGQPPLAGKPRAKAGQRPYSAWKRAQAGWAARADCGAAPEPVGPCRSRLGALGVSLPSARGGPW